MFVESQELTPLSQGMIIKSTKHIKHTSSGVSFKHLKRPSAFLTSFYT